MSQESVEHCEGEAIHRLPANRKQVYFAMLGLLAVNWSFVQPGSLYCISAYHFGIFKYFTLSDTLQFEVHWLQLNATILATLLISYVGARWIPGKDGSSVVT